MNSNKTTGRTAELPARCSPLALTIGLIAAVGTLVLATGCKRIGVNATVDVTSFMPPESLGGTYSLPAGASNIDLQIDPIAVDLEQAVDGLANAEEMTLDFAIRFDNQSGEGVGTAEIYFGASAADAYADPVVVVLETVLTPEKTSRTTARIPIEPRVLALFKSGYLWMGVRMHWEPTTSDALVGEYAITKIHARVQSQIGMV